MAWLATPSAAKTSVSRRLSFRGMPKIAAAPITTTPAIRNRAASTNSGGQSTMASLPMENAEAHSRQNAATRSGNGTRSASERALEKDSEGEGARAAGAVLMGQFLSGP